MKHGILRRHALLSLGAAPLGPLAASDRAPASYKVMGVEIPPLIMATPYGATGVVTEVTQRAFKRAGLAADVEVVPWARGYSALQAGQCDALIPTIRSAEREALFDFPNEPVYRSEMSLFSRPGLLPQFSGRIADLQGRSFVKLRGALFAPEFDAAVRDGRIRCEEASSFAAAIRMIDLGRVEFAAVPRLTGLQVIAAEGLAGRVAAVEPPLHVQAFFLAFARKPGQAGLPARIDEQLGRMWRDGSIAALEDEYRRRNWLPPTAAKTL